MKDIESELELENQLSEVLTTDKQKAFLRNRLAGMNKRQAALKAGYSQSCASVVANRLTNRLECNEVFINIMEEMGLTIEVMVKELKRGITEANHPRYSDMPDNYARAKYLDMALRIYGAYAPTKLKVDEERREMKIVLSESAVKRIERATQGRNVSIHASDPPQEDI